MWNSTGPDSNQPSPPGVTVDYGNPKDIYWTLNIAMISVFTILTTVFFTIRAYVRVFIRKHIYIEDWTCFAAYMLFILYIASISMSSRPLQGGCLSSLTPLVAYNGAGHHAWEISKEKYYRWLKWFYISTTVYCPAAFCTKTTILLVIARVFRVERYYSKCIYYFIWASLAAYVPMEVVAIFLCRPIRTLWDPSVQNGYCLNQRKVFFASIALAIVTDVIILLIPIPLVYRLERSVQERIKVLLLLGIGGIATGATCFRAKVVADFLNSDDITVDYTRIGILTTLEITVGIACSCFPSTNVLIARYHSRRLHQLRSASQVAEERLFHLAIRRRLREITTTTRTLREESGTTSTTGQSGSRARGVVVELDTVSSPSIQCTA